MQGDPGMHTRGASKEGVIGRKAATTAFEAVTLCSVNVYACMYVGRYVGMYVCVRLLVEGAGAVAKVSLKVKILTIYCVC